jgi:hypothetical protein
MQEKLIKFETAKLAKEKGFDIYTRQAFCINGNWVSYNVSSYHGLGEPQGYRYYNREEDYYAQPTQSLLQKWLRDIHNIHIDINLYDLPNDNKNRYIFYKTFISTFPINNGFMGSSNKIQIKGPIGNLYLFDSYETALEYGLLEALKLI